jgi:hypothetical protein
MIVNHNCYFGHGKYVPYSPLMNQCGQSPSLHFVAQKYILPSKIVVGIKYTDGETLSLISLIRCEKT